MKKLIIFCLSLIIIPVSSQFANTQAKEKVSVKIALILDTSNSMDGLINQAKTQLWNVVNEFSNAKCDGEIPNLEIALYEYGNDKLSMLEGYIRLVTPFTNDLDLISEKLFSLKTNGGSEYCGFVIDKAVNALEWGDDDSQLKMIFIAGNEPFDQGNVDYHKSCKIARNKDVYVNTIFCGNPKEGVRTFWKNGADIGGGEYMNIEQDHKRRHIITPYDDKILALNSKVNKTYVAYGSKKGFFSSRQEEQDGNALGVSKEVAVSRTKSKTSSNYKNSRWDLVDAVEEDSEIFIELSDADMPDEMKNMTDKEKKEYILKKKKERESLKKEINDLNAQRDKYVSENRKEDANESQLDKVIINAVHKQAATKNIIFNEK